MTNDTQTNPVCEVGKVHEYLDTIDVPPLQNETERLLARVNYLASLVIGTDLDQIIDELKGVIDELDSELNDGAEQGDQADDSADPDL